jgi:hypothetical protein
MVLDRKGKRNSLDLASITNNLASLCHSLSVNNNNNNNSLNNDTNSNQNKDNNLSSTINLRPVRPLSAYLLNSLNNTNKQKNDENNNDSNESKKAGLFRSNSTFSLDKITSLANTGSFRRPFKSFSSNKQDSNELEGAFSNLILSKKNLLSNSVNNLSKITFNEIKKSNRYELLKIAEEDHAPNETKDDLNNPQVVPSNHSDQQDKISKIKSDLFNKTISSPPFQLYPVFSSSPKTDLVTTLVRVKDKVKALNSQNKQEKQTTQKSNKPDDSILSSTLNNTNTLSSSKHDDLTISIDESSNSNTSTSSISFTNSSSLIPNTTMNNGDIDENTNSTSTKIDLNSEAEKDHDDHDNDENSDKDGEEGSDTDLDQDKTLNDSFLTGTTFEEDMNDIKSNKESVVDDKKTNDNDENLNIFISSDLNEDNLLTNSINKCIG